MFFLRQTGYNYFFKLTQSERATCEKGENSERSSWVCFLYLIHTHIRIWSQISDSSFSCTKTKTPFPRPVLLLVEALARRSACGFLCQTTAGREQVLHCCVPGTRPHRAGFSKQAFHCCLYLRILIMCAFGNRRCPVMQKCCQLFKHY